MIFFYKNNCSNHTGSLLIYINSKAELEKGIYFISNQARQYGRYKIRNFKIKR